MSYKTAQVTGGRLMEIRSAFLTLAQRKLPLISDMRVATMFNNLRPALEKYVERLKALQEEGKEIEKRDDGQDREDAEQDLNARLSELTSELCEIPVPTRRLNEADLPVALKIPKGNPDIAAVAAAAMNDAGRAAIACSLAPEFFELKDPDATLVAPVDDEDAQ